MDASHRRVLRYAGTRNGTRRRWWTFRIGDEEAALEPGTLVVAPAGVEHGLANESAAPLLVFVVVVPPPPHA
mgnify:CR=1 FL=1